MGKGEAGMGKSIDQRMGEDTQGMGILQDNFVENPLPQLCGF